LTRGEAEQAIVAAIPPDRARSAVASIVDGALEAGDTVLLDRQPFVVPRPIWLGFIDLEPGRNWAHACLYVLCDADGGGAETRFARFPPQAGGRRMVTLRVGEDVPAWAREAR
jgi:hypothetical protein